MLGTSFLKTKTKTKIIPKHMALNWTELPPTILLSSSIIWTDLSEKNAIFLKYRNWIQKKRHMIFIYFFKKKKTRPTTSKHSNNVKPTKTIHWYNYDRHFSTTTLPITLLFESQSSFSLMNTPLVTTLNVPVIVW